MNPLRTALAKFHAGAVLLGGSLMPAANQDADRSSREDQVDRALSLMDEALEILDNLADVPELAARLDEVVERLKEHEGRWVQPSTALS